MERSVKKRIIEITPPDEVGRANWLNRLANGASREDVMNGFGGSQEFANMLAGFGL
ncbi:MAG: DUF4214 domain-containing protein [Butyrivibrio sp.]|uniref:DUF4214 domain-containing protein n=1 Tax=Butyrivibrio sp. TaxID=28121 RepID=UPI001B0D42E5|nr:DUF4214 domain-containing protein [Butyrivibrio sp.]MBO6242717.1 DUF4214 domain-containing protein [Butyrivibrio sp.]